MLIAKRRLVFWPVSFKGFCALQYQRRQNRNRQMLSLLNAEFAQEIAPFIGDQPVSVLIPLLLVVILLISPIRGAALEPAR